MLRTKFCKSSAIECSASSLPTEIILHFVTNFKKFGHSKPLVKTQFLIFYSGTTLFQIQKLLYQEVSTLHSDLLMLRCHNKVLLLLGDNFYGHIILKIEGNAKILRTFSV